MSPRRVKLSWKSASPWLLATFCAVPMAACVAAPPGIPEEPSGAAGNSPSGGGSGELASAGTPSLGAAGEASGGAPSTEADGGAPASSGGLDTGGAAGSPILPEPGGSPGSAGKLEAGGSPTVGNDAGAAGAESSGPGGVVIEASCAYHSDAPEGAGGAGQSAGSAAGGSSGSSGSSGAGGSGGAAPTITLQLNAFVGNYLADSTGRTLYTYGGDLPGDCHTAPVSLCVTDCAVSWPPFPAVARTLSPGLEDANFGAIHRDDGSWQTTYFGWPLYYYKPDLVLGQVTGQGKGKTWHVAQQKPPGVVLLKLGTLKYLADVAGHTLYVSAADVPASGKLDPVSNCAASCLDEFEPFHEKNFSVVTSLLIADFASFARHGQGGLQVAYKGLPLYRAASDLKAGDMTGTSVAGFTAAIP